MKITSLLWTLCIAQIISSLVKIKVKIMANILVGTEPRQVSNFNLLIQDFENSRH